MVVIVVVVVVVVLPLASTVLMTVVVVLGRLSDVVEVAVSLVLPLGGENAAGDMVGLCLGLEVVPGDG